MPKFIVRFGRTPTRFNPKEALLVEAENPVSAVMLLRDFLLRRGDDPDGFVPSIGYHLGVLRDYRLHGLDAHDLEFSRKQGQSEEELRRKMEHAIQHCNKEIAKECDRYVEEYVPPPKGAILGCL